VKATSTCEEKIFDYLLPYFEHKRYDAAKGHPQFRRKTNFGFSSVILQVSEQGGLSYVRFFLGLRHDLIENMLAGLFGQESYYRSESHTLLVETAKLGWKVNDAMRDDSDIIAIGDGFIDFMDRTGFSFLDHYRRLKACDILFNETPAKSAQWCNHQYQRCFRAMAVAHVLKRNDLGHLRAIHRTYLLSRGFSGRVVQKFDVNFAQTEHLSLN